MIGIYKIENKVNGKIYIGQSQDIERRFKQHINNAFNLKYSGYGTKFYNSIRKYGAENFELSIIEEVDKELLNEREKFYISKFDSWKNGLNTGPGGEVVSTGYGENHGEAKLNNEKVLAIKEELLNRDGLTQYQLAEKYGVTQSSISHINSGARWTTLGDYNYPIRKQGGKTGAKSHRSKLTEEEVITIRKRYVNETGPEIYIDFKDKISYTTLERALTGKTYSHLPTYRKKEKKWINK